MEPRLEAYIENHISREPENLGELERDTNLRRINGRMCSGHIQGRILKMLTGMIRPQNVLELGTFTGYSALCIAEGMAPDGKLVTVELEEELEEDIRDTFARSPYGSKIELRIGDAMEVCRTFPDNSFGMIFIDADKREYPLYYKEAKRLLTPGGYIIADNVLWDGHVMEAERRDAQTEGVRKFNRLVAEDPDMEVAILPIRDGLSIIRLKN